MSSIRVERVRELLKRELGEIIRRELPLDQGGLIVVNDVDVSADLQLATVYAGVIGTARQRKEALALLEQNRKRIQGWVGRAVVLRYTPQLRFVLDGSIERANPRGHGVRKTRSRRSQAVFQTAPAFPFAFGRAPESRSRQPCASWVQRNRLDLGPCGLVLAVSSSG